MRIGLFGGTFDPPHLGHLILAAEAFDQLHLDHLLWSPTPEPPHKRGQPLSPIKQRLELVLAAIAQDPTFELSRVELDRPGPHFVVDTVLLIHQQYPNADIFYVMGGDSFHDLPNWHEPNKFIQVCDGLGVMRRPGDNINVQAIDARLPGVAAKVHFIDAPLLEISARQIRLRISQGRPFRYYLPPAVYDLIISNHYYQLPEDENGS